MPTKPNKPTAKNDRLEAMRKKLQSIKFNSSGGFFSVPEGKTTIRILPEVHNMQMFYQPVGRHYLDEGGKNAIYCPDFTSENEIACPICELVRDLYRGSKDNKALASKINVRRQWWMNIIVRGGPNDEDKGPFIFTPGATVFQSIATLIGDEEYGDITDIHDGLDIIIERKGKGLDTEYQVYPKRNSSPLSDDEEVIEKWLEAAADLSYVELTEDPDEDKGLTAGHSVYILPYDRIVNEYGLGDLDLDELDEITKVDDEAKPTKKAKPAAKPAPKATKRVVEEEVIEDFDDDDDDTEDDDEEEEEVEAPKARRSTRH